ncbi:MAG: tRNA (adenosine(37)-N6)-dimethylallyltransferase MiaA [Bacteroidales bacterium]
MALQKPPPLIVITGPTATGKTRLAAQVAAVMEGEIISADSRQVFRGMDFGTGKDYADYLVNGYLVPYHLVDIADPGHEYSVFEFQQDFLRAYHHIVKRNKQPLLCGGTGLYIEAALKGYALRRVPSNPVLRKKLQDMTWQEMTEMLSGFRPLHNTTDTTDRERLVRAIEIEAYNKKHPADQADYPELRPVIFCIRLEREEVRNRITRRLKNRLERGMLEEINHLIKKGLKPGQLMFYGLEYRYLTLYSTGEISYEEMFAKLNTAIHQFAKRQMTWFRRMEKRGFLIHWLDGNLPMEEKVAIVLKTTQSISRF